MLGRLYAKLRRWLVSRRLGVLIVLLAAPLFLLPRDVENRNSIYGRIARSYWHIVWAITFFAGAFYAFADLLVLNFAPEQIAGKLKGSWVENLVFSGVVLAAGVFYGFFIAVLLPVLEWSSGRLFGALVRKCGGIARIPSFAYFTVRGSVACCWFSLPVWVAAKLLDAHVSRDFTDHTLGSGFVALPVVLLGLLGMRRDYIWQQAQEQIYPDWRVRALASFFSFIGLSAVMVIPLLLLPMLRSN